MKRKILSLIMAVTLMVGIMPGEVLAEGDQGGNGTIEVKYQDAIVDSTTHAVTFEEKTATDVTPITADTDTLEGGWYVVQGNITRDGSISTSGTIHLILEDNAEWNVQGIGSLFNTDLTIYGQQNNSGTIISNVQDDSAAIGNKGSITINGGIVKGTASGGGAGIGGESGRIGTITINGGTVEGESNVRGTGAGIGGGSNGQGIVIINGGDVTGISINGAGIGGGIWDQGTVTINGGDVTGISTSGKGIGNRSRNGNVSTITIAKTLRYAISNDTTPSEDDIKTLGTQGTGVSFVPNDLEEEKFFKCIPYVAPDDSSDSPDHTQSGESNNESNSSSNNNLGSNQTYIIPKWVPTTPEEIRAFELFGSSSDEDDDFYVIKQENKAIMSRMVQGPLCIAVMDAYAPLGMELVRTYSILPIGVDFENLVYSSDTELDVMLKIPASLQEEGAEFKMICVSENGMPYILDDLDSNPATITFKTDKLYAFGLYKTKSN